MRRSASPSIRGIATFTDHSGPPPVGDALHAIVDAAAAQAIPNKSCSGIRALQAQRRKRLRRATVEAAILTLDHLSARSADLRDC